ncbi:MAG: hypothetical protein HKM93_19620 [Desulfobacteraceae bacterium]|nr:hypothetical protein [Desulfobacteraceae bacterium]
MGRLTDPYQPCEAEDRQTLQMLELLLEKGFSASILTKSDLVLRDTDLTKMNEAAVSVSMAFNDINGLLGTSSKCTDRTNRSGGEGKGCTQSLESAPWDEILSDVATGIARGNIDVGKWMIADNQKQDEGAL